MLTTLIVSFVLVVLFGGGSKSFSLLAKVKKRLKAHISDKERAKAAIAHFKEARNEVKVFNKRNKKDRKAFAKLQSDRQTERSILKEQYMSAATARKQIQEELTTARLKIREFITEKEWDALVADSMADLKKKEEKIQKREIKAATKVRKTLDKISTSINKHVEDHQQKKEAQEAFSDFQGKMQEFVQQANALKFDAQVAVRTYAPTREELLKIYDELNFTLDKVIDSFLSLREVLLKEANDKKWRKISKSLKQVF